MNEMEPPRNTNGGGDGGAEDSGDALLLGEYAQRAYLEYALSVVKGRALPVVTDGQKPVQRRIVYSMFRMGLAWAGANGAKPVKSARVVGDVLGRFHPHGDQAAYDALVRMAQDFAQRYPLVDGQGNFGSRDGDGAAAMRYTEARLTPLARLLMEELDEGTVDFTPNYDGSTEEPKELPARLPFVLLNGASGIAVGMATEVPSHNLAEVAAAAVALLRNPQLPDDELFAAIPGPDFPGGAQIISSPDDIRAAYATGRGSLKLRARWKVEELARGQWQLVITELPHGVSSQKVLEEIEEISNPKVKTGKKAVTPEQLQLKNTLLAVLDGVRDESSKDAAVRLVFEPKSRTVSEADLTQVLLAHTSLETSSPINLTMVGLDGKPVQKNLRQILAEWLAFRQTTVQRRSQHRLQKAEDRIHILEGRQIVLLNIDEVIAIIRNADEPKPALIERFRLSDRQAEDILEIRLRQLARLEAIKIEQELKNLREEADKLRDILGNPGTLKRLLIKEIEADAKQFGDARRTLIQAEKRAVAELKVVDEPVTVVLSQKGWARALKGHEVDVNGLAFKAGDALYGAFKCRSVDTLIALGSSGRSYSVAVAALPGGRGDGAPVTSLIDLEAGTQLLHYFAGPASQSLVLAGSGGFGLVATIGDLTASKRVGKSFLALETGELPLKPALVSPEQPNLACLSDDGHLLTFPVTELKLQPKGGRGLTLMELAPKTKLLAVSCFAAGLQLTGIARGNKPKEELLRLSGLAAHAGKRARKGKAVEGFKDVTGIAPGIKE
ncbi:DNA topoisomerase IV subunit A [Inhella inkyongensis]